MLYFTSDLHFGHRSVITYCNRPWATVEEMDEGLIERWNETVKPEDLVVIAGDMFFCGATRLKEIMQRLHGRKQLVLGNHDWGKIKYSRHQEFGFQQVCNAISYMSVGKSKVCVNHFPYEGDHTEEDRYLEHRPPYRGMWLLHGHVHNAWKVKGHQINVGVDVWDYRPVSEETIAQIIESNKSDIERYGLEEG